MGLLICVTAITAPFAAVRYAEKLIYERLREFPLRIPAAIVDVSICDCKSFPSLTSMPRLKFCEPL